MNENGDEVEKNMEYKEYWISWRNGSMHGRSSRLNTEKKIRKRLIEEGECTRIESAWIKMRCSLYEVASMNNL